MPLSDALVQIFLGVVGFAGVGLGAWASVRVGKGANKQKAISDQRGHELGLIDRYQAALTDVEARMTKRVDDLEAEVKRLREEVRTERTARRDAEAQRDAAVHHARELREAWPGSLTHPIPDIIKDFFTH